MPTSNTGKPLQAGSQAATSLREADIVSAPVGAGRAALAAAADATAIERRGALRVALAGVAGAATLTLGMRPAHAVTDTDSGPSGDPPGRGRGYAGGRNGFVGPPGISDADHGPNADPPRRGRGAAGGGRVPNRGEQPTGYSDRDPNDPAGYGAVPQNSRVARGYSGLNDRDPSDPAGYGSPGGYQGLPRTGCTDTDPGDPQFAGQRCR